MDRAPTWLPYLEARLDGGHGAAAKGVTYERFVDCVCGDAKNWDAGWRGVASSPSAIALICLNVQLLNM